MYEWFEIQPNKTKMPYVVINKERNILNSEAIGWWLNSILESDFIGHWTSVTCRAAVSDYLTSCELISFDLRYIRAFKFTWRTFFFPNGQVPCFVTKIRSGESAVVYWLNLWWFRDDNKVRVGITITIMVLLAKRRKNSMLNCMNFFPFRPRRTENWFRSLDV